jgi:adenylate cyclase
MMGERRLMACVYADMVGYSRLVAMDDRGTAARILSLHRELVYPMLFCSRGRIASTAGDSMLMLFDSVTDAVAFAVTLQRQLQLQNSGLPLGQRMSFRIGADIGDVITGTGGCHGEGVIVAVRLQALCPPGGLCVSRAVHERSADRLALRFENMGTLTLKNVARPIEAYVMRLDADPSATRAARCAEKTETARVAAVKAGCCIARGRA